MSREALLNSLHDIRLPAEAAGGTVAEIAAAVGMAALLAGLALALLRVFGLQRARKAEPDLADQLAGLGALPEDARRVALLHLLKRHDPPGFSRLAEGERLYRPGGLTLDTIETEVRRHV